ncbi:response regulator transcription factor [Alloscardovia omnicolens]|uniref:response regulator transcription factor n=1 Tax=Alloscardovia omnicolens TaxID=419015 RepID=UPI00254CF776|nr:response regulator transcription factor [Alloscardovia omnicolens]MDK6644020.1 response regulator transcription factor [Alloscardovia omnicolens]
MRLYDCSILVIDDETDLLTFVRSILRDEGYTHVDTADTSTQAYNSITTHSYDLIICDVMLRDGNGFSLYEKLHATISDFSTPIIFLSARDEDSARLHGLGLGADDYITKPFLPQELLLRIRSILKRTYKDALHHDEIHLGSTHVSFDSGTVTRGNEVVSLTAKEFILLKTLADNRGRIVTIDSLCDALWPGKSFGLESSLIVHIRHLREKVEIDPSHPVYVVTVRGLGYKLEK